MLPPKLYLVVFLSSEPGELDKDNLFGLQKTFSLTSGKICCTISHVRTPWGNCNKCSSMIVFVKKLGLLDFICQSDQPRVFFPLVIIGC